MKVRPNIYSGRTQKLMETEDFCLSMSIHSPRSKSRLHSHEKPYLCLLLDGSYEESNTRDTSIVDTGTTLFRGPGHEHANRFYREGGICFNIEINDHTDFVERSEFSLPTDDFPRMGTTSLYELISSIGESEADVANIRCHEAIISHFDIHPVKGNLRWIHSVKERIYFDPQKPISLRSLSDELGLHPNYIVRKFKEKTGFRLSQYLNKIRIEYSVKQMLQGREKLTRIALDSGFCDQSHFNRNFRRHFPASPKQLRAKLERFVLSNSG